MFAFAAVLSLMLFAGSVNNQWGAVEERRFSERVIWFDFLICGRLAQSFEHGVFSYSGMFGTIDLHHGRDIPEVQPYNCEAYLAGKTPEKFHTYPSQVGLQGILASAFALSTSFSRQDTLNILQMISAAATAVVLGIVLFWLGREFGIFPMFVSAAALLSAEILTNLSSSVYWAIWSFYLPFAATLFLIPRIQSGRFGNNWVFWSFCFACLASIKCLFSGYEQITTALVMMTVPIVYFALRDAWSVRRTLSYFTAAMFGSFSVIIASFAALNLQFFLLPGVQGRLAGFRYLFDRFSLRTGLEESVVEDAGPSVFDVVGQQLTAHAITFQGLNVTFLTLILMIALATTLLLWIAKRTDNLDQKTLGLIAATWFSILAPLSWYVLFKQHSALHPFVVVSWHMPFIPLGGALIGLALHALLRRERMSSKSSPILKI